MAASRGQMTGLLSPLLERQRLAQAAPLLRDRRRVLDVGCGRGQLLARLHPDCAYVGIDRRSDVIDELRRAHPQHRFLTTDIEVSPSVSSEGTFDAIVMLAVIEHLAAPATTLRHLVAHLAPEGIVVLTTPHPRAEPIHAMGARLGVFSREAAHEHTATYDADGMQRLAAECGLDVRSRRSFELGLNQTFVLARSAS